MSPKQSKVFKFRTGQWARHNSSGANVIVVGARRSKRLGLLVVARVTSNGKKGRVIVAKASSFAVRNGGPAGTALALGV